MNEIIDFINAQGELAMRETERNLRNIGKFAEAMKRANDETDAAEQQAAVDRVMQGDEQ